MPDKQESESMILYERRDAVGVITLNRPAQANAQSKEFLVALDAAWTQAAEDIEVKVIVLKANGKNFSAMQAVFDIHSLGHGSTAAQTGWPTQAGLQQMRKANKND